MKAIFIISFLLFAILCFSQKTSKVTFDGKAVESSSPCPASLAALADEDVNRMVTEIMARYGLQNRIGVLPCPQVDNCLATTHGGKPFILYNAAFLNKVKGLNFSEKEIKATEKDWKALAILAHEIGHHLNSHLTNPPDSLSLPDLELEADKTAGFIIYLMGGSLAQAQLAFTNASVQPSFTHPGRQQRLDIVEKGWNDAKNKYGENRKASIPGENAGVDGNCKKENLLMPNAFTPNGDGNNDVFYPGGKGLEKVKRLRIYNRWGQLVFEKSDFPLNNASYGWDGTYKGAKQKSDVYTYTADVSCVNGEIIHVTGNVTLIL